MTTAAHIADILRRAYRVSDERAAFWASPLALAMSLYGITTPERRAAFLAQIGHESGRLHWVRELGSDAYLSKYDTGHLAERLGNTPEADGDGQRYRGRGLIQVTGRANYAKITHRLQSRFPSLEVPNFVETPGLLEEPLWASLSAADYWDMKGLNRVADTGDFRRITRAINGGLNGLEDRERLWAATKTALTA